MLHPIRKSSQEKALSAQGERRLLQQLPVDQSTPGATTPICIFEHSKLIRTTWNMLRDLLIPTGWLASCWVATKVFANC